MKPSPRKLLIFSILVSLSLAAALALVMTNKAEAQASDLTWSDPENLSQSGGADDPLFVVDADGFMHVLWMDAFAGFVSTNNTTGEWSQPIAGSFPFDNYLPTLIADRVGNIHSFWLNDRSELIYSRIAATNFGIIDAWSGSSVLADSAVNFSVAVDDLGEIHLAYIRAIEGESEPAGLYYARSSTDGVSWESETLLYESPYLRSITHDEANLQISSALQTDESMAIYIVWDNHPLRRVFLIKSSDGGQNWEPFIEVDGPRNTSGLSAPFNLEIATQLENIVLVWLVGQRGVNCSQYSKFSNDGGQSWSESQPLFSQLTAGGCPQENRMIGYTDSYATLMTNTQGQIFLAAWNGSSWSDPQLQSPLGSFIDPTTSSNVDMSCHNINIQEENLLVVGCDNGAGNDIWFIQRPLGDLTVWFPPPSVWKAPTTITNSEFEFQSLQAVANGAGEVHVLWMQPSGIFYSSWVDGEWIQPTMIMKTVLNPSDQLVATIDQDGLIYIVWTSSETGEILFSWANSSKATDAKEWASPHAIPSFQQVNHSPDLLVDASKTIFVIYSIPINEDRGVYLVSSTDRGESWTQPRSIFDAINQGWEMVDQSHLSTVGEDHLVSTWAHTSLNKGPLELYFSGFDVNAEHPEAAVVVSKPVIWNDLVGFGQNTVHRFWQEFYENKIELWHNYSIDQGETWEQPYNISSIGEVPGASNLTIDRSGQLHITYSFIRDHQYLGIKHWIWNGDGWISDEGLALGDIDQHEVNEIASAITSNDDIFTIYSLSHEDADYALMFSQRHLEIPNTPLAPYSENLNIAEEATPEAEVPVETPASTAIEAIEVDDGESSTPETVVPQISDQPAAPSNSIAGLIIGIGLAFGLVVIALMVRLLIASRKR